MATVTYDEVNLMLRLYDLRREQKLRLARSWYLDHFHLDSPDEMMEKYKAGSDEYNYSHGAELLGDGRQHREPRPDKRRALF